MLVIIALLLPGKAAILNFGVYQAVSASAVDESEVIEVSDIDQIYDLPLDETESEEATGEEGATTSRIFLPIVLR